MSPAACSGLAMNRRNSKAVVVVVVLSKDMWDSFLMIVVPRFWNAKVGCFNPDNENLTKSGSSHYVTNSGNVP
jgi:hypothetical protein